MSRKLSPVLVEIIAARIPLTPDQVKTVNPNLLVAIAQSCWEGVREATGKNDGKIIDAFNHTTDVPNGSSYCQNAYQAAVRYVENVRGITSPLFATGNSQQAYIRSPKECQIALSDIQEGDCLIYQHGFTQSGHSACVIKPYVDLGFAHTLEANTSSGPGVNSDGDGVYFRMRSLKTTGQEMHLIGAIRAFPETPIN